MVKFSQRFRRNNLLCRCFYKLLSPTIEPVNHTAKLRTILPNNILPKKQQQQNLGKNSSQTLNVFTSYHPIGHTSLRHITQLGTRLYVVPSNWIHVFTLYHPIGYTSLRCTTQLGTRLYVVPPNWVHVFTSYHPIGYTSLRRTTQLGTRLYVCLLYTSPSPRDISLSRMPSSA